MVGLGRMGVAMSESLIEQNYTVHGYDVSEKARENVSGIGMVSHSSLADAVSAMEEPNRLVWLMVPAKFVEEVLAELTPTLKEGDCIIDGGNSFFHLSIDRHKKLKEQGIEFIDCGTSGGVSGARSGASLMVGGEEAVVKKYEHIFLALAATDGYGYIGNPGAGHFAKMIHNGIEYGMMGALAEGVHILEKYKSDLNINISEALKAYEHGSIISSSLTHWLADAYTSPGYLENIAGEVPTGETEIEMEYIVAHNHAQVLQAALKQRQQTRIEPSLTGTLISAMRNKFGGHKTLNKNNNEKN